MKLKDIIRYLGFDCSVRIFYKENEEPEFEGLVFDIPWCYLDYYLYNTEDFQAIDVGFDKDVQPSFIINVTDSLPITTEVRA